MSQVEGELAWRLVAALDLMAWYEDALGDEIVGGGADGAAVGVFGYDVEAVARHVVAADEDGLCLLFAPTVEALVVEGGVLVIDVGTEIRYVAIDDAAVGDGDVGIVEV